MPTSMNHRKMTTAHVICQGRLLAIVKMPNAPREVDTVNLNGIDYAIDRMHQKNKIVQIYVTGPLPR